MHHRPSQPDATQFPAPGHAEGFAKGLVEITRQNDAKRCTAVHAGSMRRYLKLGHPRAISPHPVALAAGCGSATSDAEVSKSRAHQKQTRRPHTRARCALRARGAQLFSSNRNWPSAGKGKILGAGGFDHRPRCAARPKCDRVISFQTPPSACELK